MSTVTDRVSMKQLAKFFVPLGLSSQLVIISHVIINSTLARSINAEAVIASYAIALSFSSLTERPATLTRQVCSALVRDRISFRAMHAVSFYIFFTLMGIATLTAYTPFGQWVFTHLYGATDDLVDQVIHIYRILMFVIIFSGIRCLYHGIIISNMRTKWLTIGMIIRLVGMISLSVFFVNTGKISGETGAIIFLSGMIIECAIAFFEGRSLVKKNLPLKKPEHPIERKRQVFYFMVPLLLSAIIGVFSGPLVNAMLGKTSDITLALASFAVAQSLASLVQTFFSYTHQIVLNFYKIDRSAVHKFALMIGFIPFLSIVVLCYTPIGSWVLLNLIGVNERIEEATLSTLRIFMLSAFIFPWLDLCNGMLILRGQTKVMVISQSMNLIVAFATLLAMINYFPGWNGAIGALAISLGMATELCVVVFTLWKTSGPSHSVSTLSA